jgi:hypothetical protein
MIEQQLNLFIQLLTLAASRIPNQYLETAFYNIHFQQPPQNVGNQIYENDTLYRFGERVLCYELYHQLQNLIFWQRRQDPNFLPGCFLQGELRKQQINDILMHYEIEPLNSPYTPDLLMHTPSSFDLNACIIELKVSPHLLARELNYDILKIVEFITRYRYYRGVFIAFNITMDEITDYINNHADTERLRNSLTPEVTSRVHIITKGWHQQNIQDQLLSQILNN